jgi:hypothetical protein
LVRLVTPTAKYENFTISLPFLYRISKAGLFRVGFFAVFVRAPGIGLRRGFRLRLTSAGQVGVNCRKGIGPKSVQKTVGRTDFQIGMRIKDDQTLPNVTKDDRKLNFAREGSAARRGNESGEKQNGDLLPLNLKKTDETAKYAEYANWNWVPRFWLFMWVKLSSPRQTRSSPLFSQGSRFVSTAVSRCALVSLVHSWLRG